MNMTTITNPSVFQLGSVAFDFAERTYLMGILNVTPDSFSDGGRYFDVDRAVEHGLELIEQGADILDVGGESSRPKGATYGDGAQPVSVEEELSRIIPVLSKLQAMTNVPLSIDTTKSAVAAEALSAGAVMINDISGFHADEAMAETIGHAGAAAVIMHMQGTPQSMQDNPTYHDLFEDITTYFKRALADGKAAGIAQMFIDPGIGFGKRQGQNLQLIKGLAQFRALGHPILVGPSRKSFIGNILDLPVSDRLEGSLAAAVACVLYGANVMRVHDVKETKRALAVADEIKNALEETWSK